MHDNARFSHHPCDIICNHQVMLSDHVPIGFKIKIEEPSSDIHEFRAMSMNMLASAYMPFSFWNTPPSEGTELWLLASRARAAMDRKTKWLPGEYKSMSRSNLTAKQLDEADSCPLIEWERANRRFWSLNESMFGCQGGDFRGPTSTLEDRRIRQRCRVDISEIASNDRREIAGPGCVAG